MQTSPGANKLWVLLAVTAVLGAGQQALGQRVEPWATLKGHKEGIPSLAFSPDGRTLASASDDGTVRLWEVATGKERTLLKGHKEGVVAVVFAPDGKLLVSCGRDGVMWLWDAAGRPCGTLKGPDKSDLQPCFSPDGTTLAAGGGTSVKAGDLRLWDVRAGKVRFRLRGHTGFVSSVSFSEDGRMLAGGDYSGFTVWESASGKVRASLKGHRDFVGRVAFLPGSNLLASGGGDSTVRLWDVRAGKQKASLTGHAGFIYDLAVAGTLLASAGEDGTLRLWDVGTERQLLVIGLDRSVWSGAFSPDGKTLAAGDRDGTIRLWSVPELLAQKRLP